MEDVSDPGESTLQYLHVPQVATDDLHRSGEVTQVFVLSREKVVKNPDRFSMGHQGSSDMASDEAHP